MLVFDLTNERSFENVEFWRREFLENLNPPEGDKYPFVLLGNKNDIKELIKVKDEDIQKYCNSHNNMPYFSVSDKDNEMIEESFKKVAELAFKRYTEYTENEDIPEIKPLQARKMPEDKPFFKWKNKDTKSKLENNTKIVKSCFNIKNFKLKKLLKYISQ